MGESTAISWCDSTFNPWHGCQRVSDECTNCYAETLSHRWGRDLWGPKAPRQIGSPKVWREPLKWEAEAARTGVRRRVFCASMADVLEDRRDLDLPREWLWALIEATPHLDWLLLTKRPENFRALVPTRWILEWPANVWAGTTVGTPKTFRRIYALSCVPARIRFLSAEPLLADLGDISGFLGGSGRINWVLVGGESGVHARPMHTQWARDLRDQCIAASVPFHFKQWGETVDVDQMPDATYAAVDARENLAGNPQRSWRVGKKVAGHLLDGYEWLEFPA